MSFDTFFTRLNPLIAAILRSPFHRLLSAGLMLITVTGRTTGRRYTFPVGYQRQGRLITVMVSEAKKKSWWRNLREPCAVEMWIRGRQRDGTAQLVAPGSEEFRKRAAETLSRMPWLASQFGLDDYGKRVPLTEDQHRRLAQNIACVQIRLGESREPEPRKNGPTRGS